MTPPNPSHDSSQDDSAKPQASSSEDSISITPPLEDLFEIQRTARRPWHHGATIHLVVSDGGSAYRELKRVHQSCRSRGEEGRKILTDSFQAEWLDSDGPHAIRSSQSKSHIYRDENAESNIPKTTLSIRENIEDHGIVQQAPPVSFSLNALPADSTNYFKNGASCTPRNETGTRYKIQTTGAETPTDILKRAIEVLGSVGVEIEATDVIDSSFRFHRQELSVRFLKQHLDEAEGVVKHVGKLLNATPLESNSRCGQLEFELSNGGTGFISERFHLLEFEEAKGVPVRVKVYEAREENPPEPLSQPRIEVGVDGNFDDRLPHHSEWTEFEEILSAILLSLLRWAGVDEEARVQDEVFSRDEPEQMQWNHPENALRVVEEHYEQLEPLEMRVMRDLYHPTETKLRVLAWIARRTGISREGIASNIKRARSTVSDHVLDLKELGYVVEYSRGLRISSGALREALDEILSRYQIPASRFGGDASQEEEEETKTRQERRRELEYNAVGWDRLHAEDDPPE